MATARRALIWTGVVTLVLLNWAALDDITTGNEPTFVLEYAFVGASVALVAAWFGLAWRRKARGRSRRSPG